MQRTTWLVIATVVYGVFGLGLLIVPAAFMSTYGITLDPAGAFMTRILGSALIGFALLFWWGRNDGDSAMMNGVLRASVVYNVIDLPVVLHAVLTGMMNAMGWVPVILHVVLAAGFGYFAFLKR
jgi:hypothetical protein